jgi:GT2 family glycosyltransferase
MNNPLVSVLILNWNGDKWLEECIDSVLQTSYQPFETIVVDNASTDNSLEILSTNYKDVIVIKNQVNHGFSKGNNIGFRHAKGKYIATLNNDMVVDKSWLDEPIRYLEKDPQLGIAGCRQMKYFDRSAIDGLYHYLMKSLIFLPIGLNAEYDETNQLFSKPGYVLGVSGGSAIYRKAALEKTGGFEERFFAYHEDTDLAMRFLYNGWKCIYAPTAVVYHRGSASFKTESPTFVYYFERNRIWFIYRNWPLSLMVRFFPWVIFDEMRNCWNRMVHRKNFFVYLKAKVDAIKGLSQFNFQRKEALKQYHKHHNYFIKLYEAIKIPLNDDGKT